MLKLKFWERAEPVAIDINELYERFNLRHRRYKQDSHVFAAVMHTFGQVSLRGGGHYGLGHVYYSDENKKLIKKAPESQFADEPHYDDEHIPSSACIAFAEASRSFGKKAFGIVIRKDSNDFDSLYNKSVVFGLYGLYDRDGRLVIKKLMVPHKNEGNSLSPTKEIPVTPENVQGALRYAEHCIKAITGDERFFPRVCLEQAMEPGDADKGVKILPPVL